MARNILIFSNGTRQVGGYAFDEGRTNVYSACLKAVFDKL